MEIILFLIISSIPPSIILISLTFPFLSNSGIPLSPNNTLSSWSDLNPNTICLDFIVFFLSLITYSAQTSKTSAHKYSTTADKHIAAFNETLWL